MERVHKMVETKDIVYVTLISALLIGMTVLGVVTYKIYDTGEELTCRTGNGWVVLEEHEGFFEAQCQYKTKDWVNAHCSSFRSTPTYERYGCDKVVLVEIDNTVTEETVIDNTITEIIDKTVTKETIIEETIIHEGDDGDTIIYEGDTIIEQVIGPGHPSYVPYYEGDGNFQSCSSGPCVPCAPSPEGCIPIN